MIAFFCSIHCTTNAKMRTTIASGRWPGAIVRGQRKRFSSKRQKKRPMLKMGRTKRMREESRQPLWKTQVRFLTSQDFYWLNYWHILISKGTSGFTSNTSLIMIQYFYQFKYPTDLIKVMRRIIKWNMKWNMLYKLLRTTKAHTPSEENSLKVREREGMENYE